MFIHFFWVRRLRAGCKNVIERGKYLCPDSCLFLLKELTMLQSEEDMWGSRDAALNWYNACWLQVDSWGWWTIRHSMVNFNMRSLSSGHSSWLQTAHRKHKHVSFRNQILLGCSQPLVECPGSHVRLACLPGSFRYVWQSGVAGFSFPDIMELFTLVRSSQHNGLGHCRYPSHWALRRLFTLHPNCMLNPCRPSLNRLYSDRLHSLKLTVRPWK